MMIDNNEQPQEYDNMILKFMGKSEIMQKVQEMVNRNKRRLVISLDLLRTFDENLANRVIKDPMRFIPIFETHLQEQTNEILSTGDKSKQVKGEKGGLTKKSPYRVTFEGTFGRNMVSPRGLNAELSNQLVCIQGITTRMSIVRPKLVSSVHYSEETKQGSVKEYFDQYSITGPNNAINGNFGGDKGSSYISNAVPNKDIHGNPLTFEYGMSYFRDHQTLLVQEPPERTPVGQLPRSVEIILEDDLVDACKPGDRIQVVGVFKCISSQSTSNSGIVRTVLIASSISSITSELEIPQLSGDDIRNIKNIASRNDGLEVLANSLAPGIYGHHHIKKALVLQLLGGVEKNLENGTHLRGDINVLLIGDPSTAKSQFLRHMMAISPNAINTTGRGSSGVGLTAAVVVDKDTGERHLEAGAMVLGDRGIVCIDEFDKMNEVDRVAIHEVMEQQTVTIAKAGIHVSLNARCSVLAAANPIYGEYHVDLPANKNIGLPDSLLSRFDLLYKVLDANTPEMDRKIADRVIRNHMCPVDSMSLMNIYDEKIIEPEIHTDDHQNTEVFEKHNVLVHGKEKKDILTRSFLRKYLHYAKKANTPILSNEATEYISKAWTELRTAAEETTQDLAVPITVRTLETLIRLSTAHAKLRLVKAVNKQDCEVAFSMLNYAIFGDDGREETEEVQEEEEEVVRKSTKKSVKSSGKKTASRGMIVDDESQQDEEEEDDESDVRASGKKSKSGRESTLKDVDKLFDANVKSGPISETHKKFVYKIVYDNANKRPQQTISLEELWSIVQKNKDSASTHNIHSKSDLLDIILSMDTEGKLFYSGETKDVILI